jgi:hypothetical protein
VAEKIHAEHVVFLRQLWREPVEPVHRAAVSVQQNDRPGTGRPVLPDVDGDTVHVDDVADGSPSHELKGSSADGSGLAAAGQQEGRQARREEHQHTVDPGGTAIASLPSTDSASATGPSEPMLSSRVWNSWAIAATITSTSTTAEAILTGLRMRSAQSVNRCRTAIPITTGISTIANTWMNFTGCRPTDALSSRNCDIERPTTTDRVNTASTELIAVSVTLRATSPAQVPSTSAASAPQEKPAVLATGELISHEHATSGSVRILRAADGSLVLRLENLDTSNGPDLRVWITDAPVLPGKDGWGVFDDGEYVSAGKLKGNKGSQNYALPAGFDLAAYKSVSIWCDRFNVSFGAAELAKTA